MVEDGQPVPASDVQKLLADRDRFRAAWRDAEKRYASATDSRMELLGRIVAARKALLPERPDSLSGSALRA
jgi:hypothetical protein